MLCAAQRRDDRTCLSLKMPCQTSSSQSSKCNCSHGPSRHPQRPFLEPRANFDSSPLWPSSYVSQWYQCKSYTGILVDSTRDRRLSILARCADIKFNVLDPAKERLEHQSKEMDRSRFRGEDESREMYLRRSEHMLRERAQLEADIRGLEDSLGLTEQLLEQVSSSCNWQSEQAVLGTCYP